MRARACTGCRQFKVKCDAVEGVPGGCSRCRSLKRRCVFDPSFRRKSKAKRLEEMAMKITDLQQALQDKVPLTRLANTPPSSEGGRNIEASNSSSSFAGREMQLQLQPQPLLPMPVASTNIISTSSIPLATTTLSQQWSDRSPSAPPAPSKAIGDIALTPSQVSGIFRRFFAHYHPYLPFKMNSYSPETVYSTCPLLFWIICSVTSSWKLQSRLSPLVKNLVEKTLHSSSKTVEMVQALIILCVWPFRVSYLADDPSYLYSSLAVQIALQLGLHRPGQPQFNRQREPGDHSAEQHEVKRTTWVACSIVNHMQACLQGLPPSMTVDIHLLTAVDDPGMDATLTQLSQIYNLLMQANLDLGVHGSSPSGLVPPETRLNKIKFYSEQLSQLQAQRLREMNDDAVKISFLYAKIQLVSFALLGDMPISEELLEIVTTAEHDACELVELCLGLNLPTAPAALRHITCYCGFMLARIFRYPSRTQNEVLQDNIERVCQALSTSSSSQEDVINKACLKLQALPFLEDIRRSPPILSRMGASILFDSLRIYWENWQQVHPEQEIGPLQLDGMDWATPAMDIWNITI